MSYYLILKPLFGCKKMKQKESWKEKNKKEKKVGRN